MTWAVFAQSHHSQGAQEPAKQPWTVPWGSPSPPGRAPRESATPKEMVRERTANSRVTRRGAQQDHSIPLHSLEGTRSGLVQHSLGPPGGHPVPEGLKFKSLTRLSLPAAFLPQSPGCVSASSQSLGSWVSRTLCQRVRVLTARRPPRLALVTPVHLGLSAAP